MTNRYNMTDAMYTTAVKVGLFRPGTDDVVDGIEAFETEDGWTIRVDLDNRTPEADKAYTQFLNSSAFNQLIEAE